MSRCLFATLAALTFFGPLVAAPPDAKKFGWETDYATAKAAAERTGKPMLVVFRCVP